MKVFLICDTDSQLFATHYIASQLQEQGCTITFGIDLAGNLPQSALRSHIAAYPKTLIIDLQTVHRSPQFLESDAVGAYLTGSRLFALREAALQNSEPLPVMFCGFNGLVFEKFEEGLMWRLSYDLIYLNGPRDLRAVKSLFNNRLPKTPQFGVAGLNRKPLQSVSSVNTAPQPEEGPSTLVFVEQVAVPRTVSDRTYLIGQLCRLAKASPNWRIVVKPRVRPGEKTFRTGTEHVERTLDRIKLDTANIHISYDPLSDLLSAAKCVLTVSSTAYFDALSFGCRPYIVSDFGVRNGDGTHAFIGSGTHVQLAGLTDLDRLPLINPDQEWLTDLGFGPAYNSTDTYEILKRQVLDRRNNKANFLYANLLPVPPEIRAQWVSDWQFINIPAANGTPDNTAPPENALQLAKSLLDSHDTSRAIPLLSQVCVARPTDSIPRRALAEAYIQAGNYAEAKRNLKEALLLKPGNENIRRRLRAVSGSAWRRKLKMLFSEPFLLP